MFSKAYIPFRGYYSSPFSRWQGSFQYENSIELGAKTARRWLEEKNINPEIFDYFLLGKTVGQKHTFYSAPWAAAMVGAGDIPGLHVPQACSTSTTCLNLAAMNIEVGINNVVFSLMTDRCSNGPHTIWPNPLGPGGEVIHENWLMDNFNYDPWGRQPMIQTAENVVKEAGGITKEDCDELSLRRYEQYMQSLENDREFQKRYMFPVESLVSKKKTQTVDADEGIPPTTKEGVERLKPVLPDGVHSFAAQTHPADGNCAIIVTTKEKAQELSDDSNIKIQIISYGYSRAPQARMAMAPVPAASMALQNAGLDISDMKSIKTHNPFAANDLYFAREFNIDVMNFNNYGSSLIFGHPQGPTAGRCIIEMIEELVVLGGGYGLFTGCAAGDTGAAMIIKVDT